MKSYKISCSLTLIIIITSITWFISCNHKANISDLPEICFEGDVLPVFLNSCAISGCHNGKGESDLILNNYTNIRQAVVAGSPNSSSVYKAITSTWGENKMPPAQPLSLANRTIIRIWIEQGAGQTLCGGSTGTGGVIGTAGNTYVNPRACFSRDILPALVSRCASANCHDAISHKSGYNFTSFANAIKAVKPGNPGSSKLYQVIKLTSGEEKMPPSGKPQLSIAEIDSIGKWIGYGALNENCGEVCDTINPITFSGTIWPIIQSSCTGCHSGTLPSGNVLLASYSNVAIVSSNGLLIKSLNGTGVTRMPPSGSFSACRIRQFVKWVNNGFINN